MMDKDQIADQIYKAPYARLSAFGQDRVDQIGNAQQKLEKNPVLAQSEFFKKQTTEELVDFLARRVANLELEYEELWIEHSEVRSQLAALQAEINQKFT